MKYFVEARTIYPWKALRRETERWSRVRGRRGRSSTNNASARTPASRGANAFFKPWHPVPRFKKAMAPSITREDLRPLLKLPASVTTLWATLKAWKLVLKKSPSRRRAAPA